MEDSRIRPAKEYPTRKIPISWERSPGRFWLGSPTKKSPGVFQHRFLCIISTNKLRIEAVLVPPWPLGKPDSCPLASQLVWIKMGHKPVL